MILLILLYYFLLIYTASLLIYIIIQIARKKKLPWVLILIEMICIIIFFYLQNLVDEHKLIFTGKYEDDGSKDWGVGLANIQLITVNLIILISIFSVTQIVFWYFFSRHLKHLNAPDKVKNLLKTN